MLNIKWMRKKIQAFRKKPSQPTVRSSQPYIVNSNSILLATEGSCDRSTFDQIQAEHLVRSAQQVPDVAPTVYSPRLSHLLSKQAESSNAQTQATPVPQSFFSREKAKARCNADYELALSLQLQVEGDDLVWPEPVEDIIELDDDEYLPHPASPLNSIHPQPRIVASSSSSISLQPIPRASFRPSHASESTCRETIAEAIVEGWEAYDAQKWVTAQPQLIYAVPHKECIICADEKSVNRFPQESISDGCTHDPNTCLDCIEIHIKTELESKLFHAAVVTCPECRAPLVHDNIRTFADPTTFESYASRATDNTIDQIADLFRCPDASCNSAQVHVDGEESPIVICFGCSKKYCFKHKFAWHTNLSCDEYDQFLANPRGFKSRLDLENEKFERERVEEQERLEREEEASHAYIQELLEGDQLEEARRQAEVERIARMEIERQEMARREEKTRRDEEARRKLEREALQRQENEQANLRTIQQTTKNCPNCSWPIEKNEGCAHMTCIKCRHEFYWCCLVNYNASHRRFCSRT